MAETVRIDPVSHAALADIARAKHIPLTEALSRAVETYRRAVFLEGLTSEYEALRLDASAWDEERREREAWEVASADGLANE